MKKQWLIGLVMSLILLFSVSILVIKPVTIIEESMNPTLKSGEKHYVLKYMPINYKILLHLKRVII